MADIRKKPTGLCTNCNKRDATIWWAGEADSLSVARGYVSPWCEMCGVRAQIKHAEETLRSISDVRERLTKLQNRLVELEAEYS